MISTLGTSVSWARPNVPVCTYGKWLMSRKLSTIRVADVRHGSTGVLIRRNAGSASWTMHGTSPPGSPRHTHTSP